MHRALSNPRNAMWACLALAVLFVVGLSFYWDRAGRAYEARFEAPPGGPPVPEVQGRVFFDNDPYYWLLYAREMARTGARRLHHTLVDNTPQGRPVHWSQSVSWMLLLSGWLRHLFTGEAMDQAIENGATLVGPAQLVLLLVLLGPLIYRRMGAAPAVLWMISMAGMGNVYWVYHALRPDHHGLHIAFMLGSMACLVFGGLGWVSRAPAAPLSAEWFRPMDLPSKTSARRYFLASGILGGLGLWTGATVQIIGIGLIVAGGLLLVLFMPSRWRQDGEALTEYAPGLWRLWAVTGGVTSLAFYAIEYAPRFPGMRLEMNHPLYALTWFCVGEILARVSALKMGIAKVRGATWAALGVCALGALILPALLFFGPSDWHYLRAPWSWRMSRFITETWPLKVFSQGRSLLVLLVNFGVLPLFLVAAPALCGPRRSRLFEWASLWMAFFPPFIYLLAVFMQVRWMPMFSVMIVWLMAMVVPVAWRSFREHPLGRRAVLAAAVLVGAQALVAAGLQVKEVVRIGRGRVISNELTKGCIQRLLITRLAALNTDGRFRVLCEPDLAGPFAYYGRLPSLASYYWENKEGVAAAAEFLADSGDDRPREIARERGLTHVLLPHSAEMAHMFYFIRHGYFSEEGARKSMAGRLVAQPGKLPPWIRRDEELGRKIRAEYLFQGTPVFSTMDVFTIDTDKL